MAREFPPPPGYTDLPPWKHNFDNLHVRAVNCAWNLLLTRDLSEITFKELAISCGVKPPAIYPQLKGPTEFAQLLTCFSIVSLGRELCLASEKGTKPLDGFRSFLEFAQRRPYHWALIASPRFNSNEEVAGLRKQLEGALDVLLHNFLGGKPRDDERLRLRTFLYGGATLVALKAATVDDSFAPMTASLETWREKPQP